MDSLARVAGEDKLRLLREEEEAEAEAEAGEDGKGASVGILYSWPTSFDNRRALGLGFGRDESFDDIVRDFKRELEGGVNV
ncbi:hypothetical protein E4U41_005527 [Claviceps citrina]|nr:hypothetical protein E4U41_005527 [Claviceps citrina]